MAGGGPADGQSDGECYRWALINDFTSNVSADQEAHATTGETICDDASMTERYSLGLSWSLIRLRMIFAIDHLPENGCEIQNVASGRRGIILRLDIVTTAADQHVIRSAEESHVLHDTATL